MVDHECKRHPGMRCPIEAEDLSGREDYVCPLGEVVKIKCCTPIDQLAQRKLDAVMEVVDQYIPFGSSPTAVMAREIKDALESVK